MAGITGFKACYQQAMTDPRVLPNTKKSYGAESLWADRRAAALCAGATGTEPVDTFIAVISDPDLLKAAKASGGYYAERNAFIAAGGNLYSGGYD